VNSRLGSWSGSRWLAPSQIATALCEIDLPCASGPHGFDLGKFRIENGSGIAGRSYHWRIAEKRSGSSWADMPFVGTLREFRWWLRAFMTGDPPPTPRKGWRAYPRRNRNRFGQAWIWVWRRTL
jgi:hypothetical protein